MRGTPSKGAFQFLSADVRKPTKRPFAFNIAAALTGENLGIVVGCPKTEMRITIFCKKNA